MGNCQAAEAATVVIQRGGGNGVERIYWSVSASEVMNSNPGHYVAAVVTSAAAASDGAAVKQLKLLRPDDTLVLGQVYRLISFEDVLKEFAAKKSAKLGKLLKQRGVFNTEQNKISDSAKRGQQRWLGSSQNESGNSSNSRGVGRQHHPGGGGQWRPALQTIAELGT